MKKIILSFALLCCMSAFALIPGSMPRLPLTVGIVKPVGQGIPRPRTPILAPNVAIDGHTVYFDTDHVAFTVMLVDEDEQVVYQVVVPSTVDEIELPSTLSGVFELQIYDGTDYYFYCDIYLE